MIKGAIIFITGSVTNTENFTIDLTHSSFRNRAMLYSNKLPFGTLSSNSFLNIERMNAIHFCYDKNYYFISVIEENFYYEKNIKY